MGVMVLLLSEASRMAREVDRLREVNAVLTARLAEAEVHLAALAGTSRPFNPTTHSLTTQEMRILTAVAKGFFNFQIAERHTISERTVRTHVSNMLIKLKLDNRTQLAIFAWRNGVIGVDEAWESVMTMEWRPVRKL